MAAPQCILAQIMQQCHTQLVNNKGVVPDALNELLEKISRPNILTEIQKLTEFGITLCVGSYLHKPVEIYQYSTGLWYVATPEEFLSYMERYIDTYEITIYASYTKPAESVLELLKTTNPNAREFNKKILLNIQPSCTDALHQKMVSTLENYIVDLTTIGILEVDFRTYKMLNTYANRINAKPVMIKCN